MKKLKRNSALWSEEYKTYKLDFAYRCDNQEFKRRLM